MVKSKQSQEIISLGKKLIREFCEEDRRDTTLGWMAHYLSELIVSVENETEPERKAELKKEACEVILIIWSKRNGFLKGSRPLSGLSSAVEVINSLKENDPKMAFWERMQRYEEGSPWGNFAKTLKDSSERIFDLTFLASIGQKVLLREKEWEKFPSLLSDDEIQILGYLDRVLHRAENPVKIVIADASTSDEEQKPEKIDEVLNKIDAILKEQMKKFEALKSTVFAARQTLDHDKDDNIDPELNDFLD
ncbi:hypothetical protein [Sphingobacterium sp. JB170]|uniref:hypothetical protein n=1 Tax=Sphingobacterium sp. JB170 TaxID=1434842 RepID=UPI00097EE48B|nr:hypothetical protein [Sphingobacterium sp. JB170]SJN27780.1 hypothetical protein FM107_05450 [Sphingobacterium sp. JB170]